MRCGLTKIKMIKNRSQNELDDFLENNIALSYVDSTARVDIENFIFNLTLDESMVLTLKALGYTPREIRRILKHRNPQKVYKVILSLKEFYKKEEIR